MGYGRKRIYTDATESANDVENSIAVVENGEFKEKEVEFIL